MRLDIKKVDDKPMVIHSKQKTKLHLHEKKEGVIKGHNTYSSKSTIKTKGNNTLRDRIEDGNKSIKIRDKSLHIKGTGNMTTIKGVGELGANMMADQIEGGDEIRDATYIAGTMLTPASDMTKHGYSFTKEAIEKAGRDYIRKKIKKQDISKRLVKDRIKRVAKKTAKKTASDAAKETSKEIAKEAAKTTAEISAQIAAQATAEVATEVAVETAGATVGTAAGPEGTLIGWAAGKKIGKEVGDQVGRSIE